MNQIKKYFNRYKKQLLPPYKSAEMPIIVISVILVVSLIATVSFVSKDTNLFSKAATINSVEAENGTISGNVTIQNDSNASGGKYISFETLAPTVTSTPVSLTQMLLNTKEINYYPAANGWTYMWTRFDPTTMDNDFAKIQGLGFNTVRLILQAVPGAFDYPAPTAAELNQLDQVIALAAKHNLKVHLTLFDFWSQYADITGSKQWADKVVKPYAGDSRVSIIELQNEIDPANATAMTWAQTMIPYIKSIDGGLPVTISEWGVSRMQSLYTQLAATPPDFWDFHLYEFDGLVYSALGQVKSIVQGAPLFIGEIGYSTYPQSTWVYSNSAKNTPAQEAEQEYFYRLFTYATQALGLPLASPWIYSDFASSAIPYSTTTQEYNFGLYRLDGSAKPAAATIQSLIAGNPVDTSFNNGFEQSDGQGLPTYWRLWQSATSGFTADFAWDNTTAHTGVSSAKISNSTSSNNGTASYYVTPVQFAKPGQQYTYSVWAKGLNATGNNSISIAWFDNNNTYLSQSYSPLLPTGTTNWQTLSVTATAPANAATMELHLNSKGNTGSVWFDDVIFTAP